MTSLCDRIQEQAAGLASLTLDDPERRQAFAHATACAGCAAALAEGSALLGLLDQALRVGAPSRDALARAKRSVRREVLSVQVARPPGARAGVTVSVAATLLAEWCLMTFKHWDGSPEVLFSAALAMIAAMVAVVSLRPRSGAATLVPLPLVSLGVALLGMEGTAGLEVATGVKCAVEVVAAAGAPLVAGIVLASRGGLPRPEVAVAAIAGAGALNAQAALRLGCHAFRSASHLLLFHSLPVILVVGACFAFGTVAVARRRPPGSLASP